MKEYDNSQLNAERLTVLLKRPTENLQKETALVHEILGEVAARGDAAVLSFTERFDGVRLSSLEVSEAEIENGVHGVPDDLKEAIAAASKNIAAFHRAQHPASMSVETAPGVVCRREWRPIERVGLYVPGGSAPLLSTVLMLGIPARIAGCREIVLCTPPSSSGTVEPAILAAAKQVGITNIIKAGGAQAIAAMAIGTETVPKADKIFGPGNRFVAAAKAVVSQPPYNVAIDMLAGPSELLVIADESADPAWVAADLLSQAEHGIDSQVVLVATSEPLVKAIEKELKQQLASLPRQSIAERVVDECPAIICATLEEAISISNHYAPEHLILAVRDASSYARKIQHAGSVFLGSRTSVVFGDYASGTNHTLPTAGTASSTGGLIVESFMKPVLFQEVTESGLAHLTNIVPLLARAEKLEAHARAAEMRKR